MVILYKIVFEDGTEILLEPYYSRYNISGQRGGRYVLFTRSDIQNPGEFIGEENPYLRFLGSLLFVLPETEGSNMLYIDDSMIRTIFGNPKVNGIYPSRVRSLVKYSPFYEDESHQEEVIF